MTGKGNPERVVLGAAVLAMCWFFPHPVVGGLALAVLIGLFYSGRPGTAPAIEDEGRNKIMARLGGLTVLFALAGYGVWSFPHPLLVIVWAPGAATLVTLFVMVLFTEDRRAARRSKPAARPPRS
jgi:hypothetical protein